jgi:two-component system, sensor histidine kinase and response regulator
MKEISECTILIVDDTEENLDILVEALSDEYGISVAMDGETALEILKEEVPDIILLDIIMPGMDGYDVCKKIKENKETTDIPIIFLTAITEIESKSRGFESGAVDYITKPFEILEVKARIRTHLSLKLAKYELSEKNKILEQKTVELENAFNELEAFSYTVSHDLKSPIRAIEAYVKIILEEENKKLQSNTKEIVSKVNDICGNTITMIENLLKYSKVTNLEICRELIDISKIFKSTFEQYKAIYDERIIEFEFETGMPKVWADSILIKQVISNIISNSIKFTKNECKASIIAGCKRDKEEYIFYVKDNGAGIDMEFSGKLFGVFQRLHSQEDFHGNGIGLAIVRKIIQKHEGRTWIEGKVNEGAIIYFTLPAYS